MKKILFWGIVGIMLCWGSVISSAEGRNEDVEEELGALQYYETSPLLEDGVYRIANWGTLESMKVENFGITNLTNVVCSYDMLHDADEVEDKNSLWLLTHLANDYYTIRPVHKPNLALDRTGTNVDVYGIGIDYSFSLDSTQWKITLSSSGNGYIIQNIGIQVYTLALDENSQNVCVASGYQGSPYERWYMNKLSEEEESSLQGIIVYGKSAVQVGTGAQLSAGVFSTSSLNQSVQYSSNYYNGSVTTGGYITGSSVGNFLVNVVSTTNATITGKADIKIVSDARQTATLIGIPSNSGGTHDHISYFRPTASSLRQIYGSDSSIIAYTSVNEGDDCAGYIANSDVFVYRGHGTSSYIIFGDSAMYSPIMTASSFNQGEMRVFSDSDLVLYCCCLCGAGGANANNLVVSTYKEGAKNVIGFTVEINCAQANVWLSDFCYRISLFDEISSDVILSVISAMSNTYYGQTVCFGNTVYLFQ